MMRLIVWIVLVITLLGLRGVSQTSNNTDSAKGKRMFATNEYWGKGGIGIINKNLYVTLKSDKNQLLNAGGTWTGLDASKPEVIIVFDKRIWSMQSLPDGFDISKAVLISFENDKIRFFDFSKMSGGFYRR